MHIDIRFQWKNLRKINLHYILLCFYQSDDILVDTISWRKFYWWCSYSQLFTASLKYWSKCFSRAYIQKQITSFERILDIIKYDKYIVIKMSNSYYFCHGLLIASEIKVNHENIYLDLMLWTYFSKNFFITIPQFADLCYRS